jgi:hypothetical protein
VKSESSVFMLALPMMIGSAVLFIFLFFALGYPYGLQIASAVGYSAAVVLYTFSSNRGLPRYLFTCPVVGGQLYRFMLRHFAFLIALFGIETTALQLRPRMPARWLVAHGRDMSWFALTLFIVCGGLLLVQVFTNRSVLKRAHLEHEPQ